MANCQYNLDIVKKLVKDTKQTIATASRLMRLFWDFDKWLFLGQLFVICIPAIIPFVNALIYKSIVDLVISSVNGGSFNYSTLYYLLGTRVVTLFLQDASFTLQRYFESLLWIKFPIYLYQEVLGKLSSLDVQHFENSDFKNRLEKVKESYAWKPQNIITTIFYSIQSILQFSIALVAIATLNWYLLVPIILSGIFSLFVQTKVAEASWGIWSEQSPYRKKYWYLSDLLQGGQSVKEIKIFQLAGKFLNEINKIYVQFDKENTTIASKQVGVNLFVNLINVSIYIGIEIFVIFSAIAKRITIGDVTYYTTVIVNFQNGLNGLFRNITTTYENSLYVKDMFELIDTQPIILNSKKAIVIDTNESPKIEFRNVSFHYPDATQNILNNFSIVIEPGQKIALVGENGVGKSTIIKLLARFYDVSEGQILINDHDIKDLDITSWHRSLGILFQDFMKYEYPLDDNIYFGRVFDPKSETEIIKAAKESGADLVAESLPKKYRQMLGKTFEGGVELSTGQWQKVALARAFLRNSPILILDEPTAAIDAKAEYEIFEKVEKLSKAKTVIIISHRFSTVRNADKIYVIKDGGVIESGSHESLLKVAGIYAKLFQLQAKGYK